MNFEMLKFRRNNLIKKYNALREKSNHVRFCNAPLTSLRFHRNGGVQFCCHHIEFQYLNQKSLKEIWFGTEMGSLRKSFQNYQIPQSCNFCAIPFYAKDFSNVNALSFDYLKPNENSYPVLMDFSLENTCNLSCIMCDSSLSSKIQAQKNRIDFNAKSFCYDEKFVEQILEFIPHLKYAVFTGGEPFLINIYYQIWEKMHEINPSIIINVTTNGTIFNQRVSSFLHMAKVNITVSVDSFVSNTYNEIRVGADFTQTLSNVYKFAEICHINKTQFTITVCPMIINAFEIPEIVNRCNEQNWNWNFNTVLKPWYHALWSLEKSKIQEIIDFYKNYNIKGDNEVSIINKNRFYSLISLLETWLYRVSNINSSSLNTEDLSKMRNRITQIFTQALAKTKVDFSSKVIFVVDGIPDILIRQKFIFYIESLSNSMIVNEFVDNDEDTIIDHMCIVAFNL